MSTNASMRDGRIHDTFVPSPTPRAASPAATRSHHVAELRVGPRAILLVDRHHLVGRARGALLDQLPEALARRCRCSRASATGGAAFAAALGMRGHERGHENVRTPRAIVPLSIAWIAFSNSAIGYVTDTSSSRRISPRR